MIVNIEYYFQGISETLHVLLNEDNQYNDDHDDHDNDDDKEDDNYDDVDEQKIETCVALSIKENLLRSFDFSSCTKKFFLWLEKWLEKWSSLW